jgi:hypothetical protein
VSAIIVIALGEVAAVPPATVVLNSVLFVTINLAAVVDPEPSPEMVMDPGRPAVLSVLKLRLLTND